MKIKRITLRVSDICILVFNLFIISVFDRSGSFKYIFGVFVSAALLLFCKKAQVRLRFLYLILPYIFYIFAGGIICILDNSINKYCFEQPTMYLVPFLTALMVYLVFEKNIDRLLNLQFVAILCIFLWHGFFSFTYSDLMEGKYAFIFGAYFIYFSYKKKFLNEAASLLLLFLAHKRIALLGVIAVWGCMKLFGHIGRKSLLKKILVFFTLFCFGMLAYIFLIHAGFLYAVITKLGVNTQGRLSIYAETAGLYTFSPGFRGIGIGNVRVFLDKFGNRNFALLHNDILAMYIEIGFLGVIVFFATYLVAFRVNARYVRENDIAVVVLLFIYTLINYMTDNISIYISYLYPFYLIIFRLLYGRRKEKATKYMRIGKYESCDDIWE